tara:strand:- start:16700 stop:17557 length:858 start_codon:yes stop_codon:yes gene_type:complete
MSLAAYLQRWQTLKPNRSGDQVSPHKMCLLYAVIDLIEQGLIKNNRIVFNAALCARFTYYFDQLKTSRCRNAPHLPFYYLRSSGFWHLHTYPDQEQAWSNLSSPSSRQLMKIVAYAYFDAPLFALLQSQPHRMYFRQALSANFNLSTQSHIEQTFEAHHVVTEKAVSTYQRIGQDQFRQRLIDYWQKCAVTHCSQKELLIASHIKPWRYANDQERLDTFNGILLMPHIDKAFDLGYISFDTKGKVLMSNQLKMHHSLGLHPQIHIPFTDQHQHYLHFHRKYCYRA